MGILAEITQIFSGSFYNELTVQEKEIVDILINQGYIMKDEKGILRKERCLNSPVSIAYGENLNFIHQNESEAIIGYEEAYFVEPKSVFNFIIDIPKHKI